MTITSNSFNVNCYRSFEFLLKQGFNLQNQNRKSLDDGQAFLQNIYVKDGVEVEVFFSNFTHEITSTIKVKGERFSVSEIGMTEKEADPFGWKDYAARDEITLKKGLELNALRTKIALNLLKGLGNELISNVKAQRKEFAEKMAQDSLVRKARLEAHEAFRQKDFRSTIVLFDKMKSHLDKIDSAKLKFALKKNREAN